MAKKTNTKKCGDCIHLHACQLWNMGRLENAEAEHCSIYETVKGSNVYYLGFCDCETLILKALESMEGNDDK